jgi:hypothetical protein
MDQVRGFGAVAQLGERLPCTQEVRSSILLGSTNEREVSMRPARADIECNRFDRSIRCGLSTLRGGSMFFNNLGSYAMSRREQTCVAARRV